MNLPGSMYNVIYLDNWARTITSGIWFYGSEMFGFSSFLPGSGSVLPLQKTGFGSKLSVHCPFRKHRSTSVCNTSTRCNTIYKTYNIKSQQQLESSVVPVKRWSSTSHFKWHKAPLNQFVCMLYHCLGFNLSLYQSLLTSSICYCI